RTTITTLFPYTTLFRSESGEAVEAEDNVTFTSRSALASVMSDKRHELLKHLHRHPAPSLRALARELGRDYKRVYEDVAALASVRSEEHTSELQSRENLV